MLLFVIRTSHLTLVFWWILEITAKSAMDLEKQNPVERTLSHPEVEVDTMMMADYNDDDDGSGEAKARRENFVSSRSRGKRRW